MKNTIARLKSTANKVAIKAEATSDLELPKFRYIEDVTRFLADMSKDIRESGELVRQHQESLATVFKTSQRVTAGDTFTISDGTTPADKNNFRKMKVRIDPELTKVVIPSVGKLKTQYALAEDLYEKHRTLEAVCTQMAMQFPDRRGEAYAKAEGALKELKDKVAKQLTVVLAFLNDVAGKHIPKSFQKYISAISDLVSDEVIFKDSEVFLYVSVDDNGDLVFSSYLMLIDAINDDGDIHPHLYISIQWVVGGSVFIQLNPEFELPNVLLKQGGTEVGNAGSATKAISDLLALERFSTALGDIPLALQLKVDPSKINLDLFSYREFIKSVTVESTAFVFTLRKDIDQETVDRVKMQIYKELQVLVKNTGSKIKLSEPNGNTLKYTLYKVAKGGEANMFDCEWLADKFGLTDQQLKKVVNILNSGVPGKKETPNASPDTFKV